ncbi:hypothetical protein PC116_g30962, partial [Phytophthora cactorum]
MSIALAEPREQAVPEKRPFSFNQATSEPQTLVSDRQTPNSRAEALQLHLEQRLLASAKDGGNSKLLDAARQAFRSHIRAYATHVRDERVYFDITQLHLGHTAK